MKVDDLRTFLSGADPDDRVETYPEAVVILHQETRDLEPYTVVTIMNHDCKTGSGEAPCHPDELVNDYHSDYGVVSLRHATTRNWEGLVWVPGSDTFQWVPRG